MHFKINLTMVSILVIVVFFNIPFYNNWMNTNLLNPQMNITEQSKHLDNEERRAMRYGYSYLVYKDVIKAFQANKAENPVLLLPPDAYLKKERIMDLAVVEPCIFYYFTGYKAVWYDSPDVAAATYALVPDANHRIGLKRINNPTELNQLLAIYKTYKLDL